MNEPLWYLKIDGKWVYREDGSVKAHTFIYAEAFTFMDGMSVVSLLMSYYPEKLIEFCRSDDDEFALPENLRRVINA